MDFRRPRAIQTQLGCANLDFQRINICIYSVYHPHQKLFSSHISFDKVTKPLSNPVFSHVNLFALNLIKIKWYSWWKKSGVHQLRLVNYPHYLHTVLFFSSQVVSRISEPSTVSLAYSIYSSSDKNQDFMNQCRSPFSKGLLRQQFHGTILLMVFDFRGFSYHVRFFAYPSIIDFSLHHPSPNQNPASNRLLIMAVRFFGGRLKTYRSVHRQGDDVIFQAKEGGFFGGTGTVGLFLQRIKGAWLVYAGFFKGHEIIKGLKRRKKTWF